MGNWHKSEMGIVMAGPFTVSKVMPATYPHRRGRVAKCIALLALAIVVLAALVVLIIWLVLEPSKPSFTLENVHVSNLSLSNRRINATFVLGLEIKNYNKRISVVYDSIDISVWYDYQTIALGSISGYIQPRHNTTKLQAVAVADSMPVKAQAWNDLRQQRSKHHEFNDVEVRLMSEIHFKIRRWKSRRYYLKASCWINALPLGPSESIDTTDCDVHI
ncbi:NDR1/HIN1-like protein 26 [Nymphaea colorata]|uniref:NDR1/HIN1-like protein 26 n=1 Tax=Nymphaea colorata TaxID=210225 RepID=UPI00214F0F66|nr:NDR1/HIN1-like protein 26 [Nymphaea colorata]